MAQEGRAGHDNCFIGYGIYTEPEEAALYTRLHLSPAKLPAVGHVGQTAESTETQEAVFFTRSKFTPAN